MRAPSMRVPALVILAYAALVIAWVFSNPPFAAPDEPDHYVRAIGLAGGQLIGEPADYPQPPNSTPTLRRVYALYDAAARNIRVPAGLWARGLTCNAFAPAVTAGCLDDVDPIHRSTEQITLVSAYEPAPYLLPGLLARLGNDPFSAVRLGRLGSAFVCLCLLALAVALLWGRDPFAASLVGLVIATTPMVVFTAAILNPSGPEIMSAIAFTAALMRLTRCPTAAGWVWVGAALSGVALALSRSTGPVWLAFIVLVAVLLAGSARTRALLSASARPAGLATAAIVLAVVASASWQATYGPPSSIDVGDFVREIRPAIDALPGKFDQQVGVFGWLDASMPAVSLLAWQGMLVALLTAAVLVGSLRARWALFAASAGALILIVSWSAWYKALTGLESQGRHWLPVAVVVPLLAGEVLYRNAGRLRILDAERLFLPFAVLAGFLQVIGWYANARRHAQGADGRLLIFESPAWSPPLGWVTWSVVVVTASALLVVAAAHTTRPTTLRGAQAPN